jgi:hypothetical protein
MSEPKNTLKDRVREWLTTEGYPLEFETASAFTKCGFSVRQGRYVKCSDELREIDVLAYETLADPFVRVYQVIECKWSGDKPWVVFASEVASMANSACACQTLSSLLGYAIVWVLAGDTDITNLRCFTSPDRAGFSGRQAFSKNNDVFYGAIQSVIGKTKGVVDEYDLKTNLVEGLPEWAVLAFPSIVVKGALFEAYMDQTGEIRLEERNHIRIHWTGSDVWNLHVSVDIVRDDYVAEFATIRAAETQVLLKKMRTVRKSIASCWENRSLAELVVQPASRGVANLPSVLTAIRIMEAAANLEEPGGE